MLAQDSGIASLASSPGVTSPRLLLIDNYDSYTFNLTLFFPPGSVTVIRNDACSYEVFKSQVLPYFSGVIISPGPGRPDNRADFGLCMQLLKSKLDIPILGVCLGHQGLAHAMGGKVIQTEPMHGIVDEVVKCSASTSLKYDLLSGLPDSFDVVRYHSLIVDPVSLPETLVPICKVKDDGAIMGLAHISLPYFGVQYHPESISTQWGASLLKNFASVASLYSPIKCVELPIAIKTLAAVPIPEITNSIRYNSPPFQLDWVKIADNVDPEVMYQTLYSTDPYGFWLDSSRKSVDGWSYMGPGTSSGSAIFQYDISHQLLSILTPYHKDSLLAWKNNIHTVSFFDWLELFLGSVRPDLRDSPPGLFWGGLVGYFGYEMKAESLAKSSKLGHLPSQPYSDSQFLFADRLLAIDHATGTVWAVGVIRQNTPERILDTVDAQNLNTSLSNYLGVTREDFKTWLSFTKALIDGIPKSIRQVADVLKAPSSIDTLNLEFDLNAEEYLLNIVRSQELIRLGETYEVCLTTQARTTLTHPPSPFKLFTELRKRNPAPFSLLLQFPDVVLCSSSPERFIKISSEGKASMKPIKGTVSKCSLQEMQGLNPNLSEAQLKGLVDAENDRRAFNLASDTKERAENLMIVDLIRNDLASFCESDSVHVPSLMHVETYATVHQLVTTIKAKLRPEVGRVTAIRHCFPPGSMTGAPKLRTVQILESLEPRRRGAYSGVMGYFSLGGQVDFSVVIRTIILSGPNFTNVNIGAGGAITNLSNPDDELAEMILKSQSTIPSLRAHINSI